MVAWLIYYEAGAKINEQYISYYIREGRKLDIDVKLILVEEIEFGICHNAWFIKYQGKVIDNPDFVIMRAIYPLLSKQLEFMGFKVFNNSFVSEICNDKAKTYQYVSRLGIPMVDTSFYQNDQIEKILLANEGPSIIKAVDGHGGTQVFLWRNSKENAVKEQSIVEIKKGIGNSDVVVQPLIEGKHQDLRVYVMGKDIVAAVLRTATSGFKANFSLGGEVKEYELTAEEKRLVEKIIGQFDFGLVGIDFIIGKQGELIFNEIEDVVGARMLYQCTDINLVELYLSFILKQLNIK